MTPSTMTHEKRANRILVVDDDPKICAIIVQQLDKEGYATRTAANGFDVGLTTQEFSPDLIVLDIMLPGMNGIEVCRQLKSSEATRKIKIIGISATSDQGMIDRMRQAGVDEFMAKPFQLHKLKERIVHFLGEPHADPSLLENNRVFIVSGNGPWAKALAASLKQGGYETGLAATPEEAGFRILKFQPDVLVAEIAGQEHWLPTMVLRLQANPSTVKIAVLGAGEKKPAGIAQMLPTSAPADQWIATIRAAIGPPRKRKPKDTVRRLSNWTKAAIAASVAAVVAAAAVIIIVSSGGPSSPLSPLPSPFSPLPSPFAAPPVPTLDDDLSVWKGQEEVAKRNNLYYHPGGFSRRDLLGVGAVVTLKDGTIHEGLLLKTDKQILLRTASDIVRLHPDQIAKEEPKRTTYEEYWDRAAKIPESDAAGHYTLGVWCREQGLKEAATREFRRTVIADRNHADALKALGYHLKDGRWTLAR